MPFWTNLRSSTPQTNNCAVIIYLPPSCKRSNKAEQFMLERRGKFICNVLQWTATHGHTSVDRPSKNYIQQLCTEAGCYLGVLASSMVDRVGLQNRERERGVERERERERKWVKRIHAVGKPWSYLPNPSARAGYDTRAIFKRSLTGLNSEFSFS